MTGELCIFLLLQDGYLDFVPRESLPIVLPGEVTGWNASGEAYEGVLLSHYNLTVPCDANAGNT